MGIFGRKIMSKSRHVVFLFSLTLLLLVLTACGGAGTSNSTSPGALSGQLDASFGTGGITRTGMGIGPGAMTILPDGKIEVTGTVWLGLNVEYILSRYTADGGIDSSFGTGGKITLQPNIPPFAATGLVHQQDGKIVMVGYSYNGTDYDIHVLRFLADGTPDSQWGDRGPLISSAGTNELALGVIAQSDGKTIVVGTADDGINRDFLIARFNSDGSLDEAFGTHGVVKTSFSGFGDSISASARSAVLQLDGKIVVCGDVDFSLQYSDNYETALVRYNSDGSIDTSFGTSGRTEVSSTAGGNGFLVLENGKFYASGGDSVYRVSANGVIEAQLNVKNIGGFAVDSQGRVIVASQEADSTGYHIAITRFSPNGDSIFLFTEKLSDYDWPRTVLVQSGDRILVEASTRESGTDSLIILRFMP